MKWHTLIDEMASGSIAALSRLITLVENRAPGWRDVMKRLYPIAHNALTIGITGYPGSGKSTLTGQLALELIKRGNRVGIIAIDPSSHLTGGAFLGDRVRMSELFALKQVYIRSMGSRGAIGGIHCAARDVIKILDAFGKDVVLVETIGVGQDEIDISRTTQIVLLVCAPGQGDAIQYLKAGILETADIYVANKTDLPEAELMLNNLKGMVLQEDGKGRPVRPIIKTVATEKTGISMLADKIEELTNSYRLSHAKKRQIAEEEIKSVIKERIAELADLHWADKNELSKSIHALLAGQTDPYSIVDEILVKGFENILKKDID